VKPAGEGRALGDGDGQHDFHDHVGPARPTTPETDVIADHKKNF
jgi:hypothetical protein